MKKIAYIILPLFLLVFSSCEETEPEVYDGDSLSYFEETSETFTIQAGSIYSGVVLVTEAKSYDRTFTIEIDEASDAPANSYTIDTNLVIPANSYAGTFEVAGNVLDVVSGTKLILNLTSVEDSNVATFDNKLTLTMEQYCPFDRDNFLGTMNALETGDGYSAEYDVTVSAGTEPNELIINNFFEAGPAATTTVFLVEEGYIVEYPTYADNFLYVNPTYNSPCYVDADGYENTWSSCETKMDLNFQVLINIGGTLYTFGDTNIVLTKP